MATLDIVDVTEQPERMDDVRALFREYADEIGINLDFQGFEAELADLPGCYAAPEGCILLATIDDDIAGCIALRPFDEATAEVKRMYVRPAHRGRGIARKLAGELMTRVKTMGYRRVLLDTLAGMKPARALYSELGFKETEAYYDNPLPDVVYYELVIEPTSP
jgi:carbonic anhydrase